MVIILRNETLSLSHSFCSSGANITQTTRAGDSALGYACESGHTEVAEILLNSGAHIDDAENEGRTPLMKAARAGHTCTVRYLISKGKFCRFVHSKGSYFE